MDALGLKIRDQIVQSGGWIGFDAFMQSALYCPGLGYYTGGRLEPFGSRGDFITAPMLGSWLAGAIWNWSAPLRKPTSAKDAAQNKFRIREFGGGRGELAAELLRLGHDQEQEGARGVVFEMDMMELSAPLAYRQQQATQGLGAIQWPQQLEGGFSGLVLANEVLDAMPVKCFEWVDQSVVLEWGVSLSSQHDLDRPGLKWEARPAEALLTREVLRRQEAAHQRGLPWPKGYRGEWSPWLSPWINALHDSMATGAVLLIDYGFAEPELDHPGRTEGTVCAHHLHRRVDAREDLLMRLGQQDLTAHVNFSQLARASEVAGFEVNGFVTQARFLLNSGILWSAQQQMANAANDIERTRQLQGLQMLMSESEMGEVFKVMLLTKNLPQSTIAALMENGFGEGDRRAAL